MSKGQGLLPFKYFSAVIFCVATTLSVGLKAAPITIGSLTYDADINTQIILDSHNQRDQLRCFFVCHGC